MPPYRRYKKNVMRKQLPKYQRAMATVSKRFAQRALYPKSNIHRFKRMTQEFYLFLDNAGVWSFLNVDGTAPSCINAGAVVNTIGQSCYIPAAIVSRLSDVIQASEFETLFDSYKINGTKIVVSRLNADVNDNAAATWNGLPEIIHVNDYDDSTPPTSIAASLQYENVRTKKLNANNTFSRFNRPKIAEYAFKTSGTTIGFVHRGKNPWVDCTYPDVEHYGHKFIINNLPRTGSGNTMTLRFTVTHYLTLKGVR